MHATGDSFSRLLGHWLMREQRRAARYMPVHNLVFGMDALRYFLYRLRLPFLTLMLRTALHILEFSLLIFALPTMLYPAMLYRLASLVLEGGWWGATERMRQRIRELKSRRDLPGIQREITGWTTLAALVGMAALAVGAALAWQQADASPAYAGLIVAIALQFALRLVSRTFYSGAYALQRVLVPIEWLILPEILVFVIGMFLHPWLGEWSVSVCIALSAVLVAAVCFRSARQVTDFLRITPGRLFSPASLASLFTRYRPRALAMPALAMLAMRLHALVLVALLQVVAYDEMLAQEVLFALYLVMPLLRGASTWSQVLYLDLARTHLDVFANFRHRLERAGLGMSLAIAVVYALIGTVVLAVYATTPFEEIAWLVAYYMAASALLGFVLVSLFTRQSYVAVTVLCLLQYALLTQVGWSLDGALMASALVPCALGIVLLQRRFVPPPDRITAYIPWAAALRREAGPMAVLKVSFHPRAGHDVMADFLYEAVTGRGAGCIRDHTAWIACPPAAPSDEALIAAGCGYVTAIARVEAASGREAYGRAKAAGLLPAVDAREWNDIALAEEFRKRFPAGFVQYPGEPNPELIAATDHETRRALLWVAQAGLWLGKKKRMRGWFVTTSYRDPSIAAVFIAPTQSADAETRLAWRALVDGHNVAVMEQN